MAITDPTAFSNEASFISGVTSDAKVAATSFWTWNFNNPATYNQFFSNAFKWGSSTIGTAGGNVTYFFDTASNWTAAEQAGWLSALGLWSAEANITFSAAAT